MKMMKIYPPKMPKNGEIYVMGGRRENPEQFVEIEKKMHKRNPLIYCS